MRNLLMGAAAVAAMAAMALASPANATLQVAFSDGVNVVTCADQQSGCDIDSSVSGLFKIFTTVGKFQVTATVATSQFGKVNNLEITNAIITNTGANTGTLKFVVGDTGFSPRVTLINEGASLTFNENIGPPSTLSFFADHGDGQPGGPLLAEPGVNLFNALGFATTDSESFSGNHLSSFLANSSFSMAEGATLTMLGGSSVTGFSESMTTGVPEPKTWAMLGVGFALMAWMGVKRSHKDRLATFA